jgi:hypothetical protein
MAVPEYPRYEAHGILANHINMPKVISKEDEGYRYLLEAIKQACDCERSDAQDAVQNESHPSLPLDGRSDSQDLVPSNIEGNASSSSKGEHLYSYSVLSSY